jgi:hypothetical protein
MNETDVLWQPLQLLPKPKALLPPYLLKRSIPPMPECLIIPLRSRENHPLIRSNDQNIIVMKLTPPPVPISKVGPYFSHIFSKLLTLLREV